MATARLSAAEGHAVAINYRSDATAAEKVRAEVESVGAKAMVVQADTGVESDIMHMFEEVDRNLGTVTGQEQCRYTWPRGRFDALSAGDIDRGLR